MGRRTRRHEAMQLLAEGKVDAFLGFPAGAQELRAKKIGHVVVNSATDRPWSQYFCCMLTANREFVAQASGRHQARAARDPEGDRHLRRSSRSARRACSSTRATPTATSYALQAMKEMPYDRWREYDPEDTVRFYALRLHEAGMIKSSPQKIIAQGTDWRFLNELKKELKS